MSHVSFPVSFQDPFLITIKTASSEEPDPMKYSRGKSRFLVNGIQATAPAKNDTNPDLSEVKPEPKTDKEKTNKVTAENIRWKTVVDDRSTRFTRVQTLLSPTEVPRCKSVNVRCARNGAEIQNGVLARKSARPRDSFPFALTDDSSILYVARPGQLEAGDEFEIQLEFFLEPPPTSPSSETSAATLKNVSLGVSVVRGGAGNSSVTTTEIGDCRGEDEVGGEYPCSEFSLRDECESACGGGGGRGGRGMNCQWVDADR